MNIRRSTYKLLMRVRSVFLRQRVEEELDDELQFHIERQTEHYINQGMTPCEARYRAFGAMGGVEQSKEECRDARGLNLLDTFYQDIRYASRVLKQSPGFTAIAVLTLAIGIGGIMVIFSVVNGVILHPLPYGNSDRLVVVSEVRGATINGRQYVPPPKGTDWPDRTRVFDGLTSFEYAPFTFMDGSDTPVIIGGRVPLNYFSVLQAKPRIGREFTEHDLAVAEPNPAIVTHGFWQSRLGGDPNVLGKTLKFAERGIVIIGVMPEGFRAPINTDAEIFTPVERGQVPRGLIGRLKPGMTQERTEATTNSLIKEIEAEYHPGSSVLRYVQIQPLTPVDASNRKLLLLLFGSVGFILLIAIINVANLMLSRTITREREIAVRAAIGAGRRRLVRQLLTESLLLALVGGAFGLLAGYAGTKLLLLWIPERFPRVQEIYVDPTVVGFVLITTMMTSITFGVFPAFAFSRPNLQHTLKEGAHHASENSRNRYLRHGLVAIEIGLAALLLIGAALIGTSFWNLVNVPLGIEPHDVFGARLNIPLRYRTQTAASDLRSTVIERIKQHPEVESVSMVGSGPVFSGAYMGFWLEGQSQRENALVLDTQVTSEYFKTLQIPFIQGQTFKDGDPDVVIINQTFARRYWPDTNPIGRRLRLGWEWNPGAWLTIGGVVRDQRPSLTKSPEAQVFRSCQQCGILLVKARDGRANIGSMIRREIASIGDTLVIVTNRWSMETALSEDWTLLDSKFRTILFAAFAGAGLLLALAGVYGVTSYSSAQRTREVGIRMALGATRWSVLRLMISRSMVPIGAGIAAGLAAAWALMRLLQPYLFEVRPTETGVFIAVSLFLAMIATIANFIPVRRGTRIDPMTALKYE